MNINQPNLLSFRKTLCGVSFILDDTGYLVPSLKEQVLKVAGDHTLGNVLRLNPHRQNERQSVQAFFGHREINAHYTQLFQSD